MKKLLFTLALAITGIFAQANTGTLENDLLVKQGETQDLVVAFEESNNFVISDETMKFMESVSGKTAEEIRNMNTAEFIAFAMNCFDFYDSCGGAWTVCHEGVSTGDLIAFLWEWDGGC